MNEKQANNIIQLLLCIGVMCAGFGIMLQATWILRLEKQVNELQSQCEVITHRPVALSFDTLKRIAGEVEKQEP